jgi:hypothetical protein
MVEKERNPIQRVYRLMFPPMCQRSVILTAGGAACAAGFIAQITAENMSQPQPCWRVLATSAFSGGHETLVPHSKSIFWSWLMEITWLHYFSVVLQYFFFNILLSGKNVRAIFLNFHIFCVFFLPSITKVPHVRPCSVRCSLHCLLIVKLCSCDYTTVHFSLQRRPRYFEPT